MKCTLGPMFFFPSRFRAEDGREDLVRLRGGYDYLIYSSRHQHVSLRWFWCIIDILAGVVGIKVQPAWLRRYRVCFG